MTFGATPEADQKTSKMLTGCKRDGGFICFRGPKHHFGPMNLQLVWVKREAAVEMIGEAVKTRLIGKFGR